MPPRADAARRVELVPRPYGWLGTFAAMASPCEVHIADADRGTAERVLELAAGEAWRIEEKFSRYRPDNVVHAINTANGRPVSVDQETARLIDYAAAMYEISERRFDITSGVLRRVWKFDGSDRVPRREAVRALLCRVGWERASWEPPELVLAPGMEIDLGGIGKEYAVDRAGALVAPFTRNCLINFGGDLLALGPAHGGRAWSIGIEDAQGSAVAAKKVELAAGALATSGDARRYLLRHGVRYSHILDPLTGWPVVDAPRSVTVAAPSCAQAGMLATLASLRGAEAEAFLAAEGVQHWCLR